MIKNIDDNFSLLTSTGSYYEQEITTKFEDAFIMECGPGKTGLTIIHGQRSMIYYENIAGEVIKCELGDMRFIMYSELKKEIRQLFVQFKRGNLNSKLEPYATVNDNQFELYNKHPLVKKDLKGIYKNFFRHDPAAASHSDHAGTMFAIEYKNGSHKSNIYMTNCKSITRKRNKCTCTVLPTTTSSIPYEYCDTIASLKELLENMKDMKVGRKIGVDDLKWLLCKKDLPNDLEKLIREKNTCIDNYSNENSDINEFRSTLIMINVDKLD